MIDRYNEVGIPTSALEQTAEDTAKPAEDCIYPSCEKCDKYHGSWCTVPIVVSKQNFLLTADLLRGLDARLTELEKLVIDEIFTTEIEVEIGKDGKLYRKDRKPCIVIREPKGTD